MCVLKSASLQSSKASVNRKPQVPHRRKDTGTPISGSITPPAIQQFLLASTVPKTGASALQILQGIGPSAAGLRLSMAPCSGTAACSQWRQSATLFVRTRRDTMASREKADGCPQQPLPRGLCALAARSPGILGGSSQRDRLVREAKKDLRQGCGDLRPLVHRRQLQHLLQRAR